MRFKNDQFKQVRGQSRLLEIRCRKCNTLLCHYQKDGPGNLRRMYLDRMIDPTIPLNRKGIECSNGHLIGIKYNYEKEQRSAIRLFVDSVTKTRIKKPK